MTGPRCRRQESSRRAGHRGDGLLWGDLRTRAAQTGHTLPVLGSLIAATALAHGLLLVTRNAADFAAVPGLQVVNPWTA